MPRFLPGSRAPFVALVLAAVLPCQDEFVDPRLLVPDEGARAAAAEILAGDQERLWTRVRESRELLISGAAEERRHGGQLLLALLTECAAAVDRLAASDDRDDWDRWREFDETLYNLRASVGDCLEDPAVGGAEAAPAALWLWSHAEDGGDRADAARILTRMRTPVVDALFEHIIAAGHPTVGVVSAALEQARERDLEVDPAGVARLANHFEAGVRGKARELAAARGIDVPPEQPDAVLDGWLGTMLRVIAGSTVSPVPDDARWIGMTVPADPDSWPEEPWTVEGWLLEEGGEDRPWRLIAAYGTLLEIDRPGVQWEPATLAETARAMIAERQRFDTTDDMDEQGAIEARHGIRRFMRSSGDRWRGSPAEVLVAAWSLERGDRAIAAELVVPVLVAVGDADDYFGPVLDEFAARLDTAMLGAFAGERDYDAAMGFARRLAAPEFGGFVHRDRALALLEQLPRRGDDFDALQLPTPAEWDALRETLPREGQIRYLVERLRLLSCQQWGIPGGIDYGQPQVGEAPSVWTWEAASGEADARVNPYTELLGMDLAGDELVALLPALESSDYVLAFDLERFMPNHPMNLHRVSWVAAAIWNEVAQDGVLDPRTYLGTDAEREAARARLLTWCRENAGRHLSDRLAERMTGVEDWQEVRRAFWNLMMIDTVRACMTMRAVVERRPEVLPSVVRLFALLDRAEFLGEALAWLDSDDADTRYFAAVLLLRHATEPERALAEIRGRIRRGGVEPVALGAVEALILCGQPGAREILVDMLAGERVPGFAPTVDLAQRLLRAGYVEAFTLLSRALAGECAIRIHPEYEPDEAGEARASMLRSICSWWEAAPELSPWEATEEELECAAAWLRERLDRDWERIRAGKAPELRAVELELPWGELRSFSTGWIRRI